MKRLAILLSFMLGISSCSTIPRKSNNVKQGEAFRHVMLLPYCPSEARGTRGALVDLLLVKAYGRLIDWIGSRLTQLGVEDSRGKLSTMTSSGYLWWQSSEILTTGVASCAVMVHSSSNPANWCGAGSPFTKDYWRICDFFKTGIQSFPQVDVMLPGAWQGSEMPQFYAEIKLGKTPDDRGVKPVSVVYYYPKGFDEGGHAKRTEARDLALTVSATTLPGGAIALDKLAIRLAQIRPSPVVQSAHDVLPSESAGWVPVLAVVEKASAGKDGVGEYRGVMAVNVTATVQEVREPRKFWPAVAELWKDITPWLKEQGDRE